MRKDTFSLETMSVILSLFPIVVFSHALFCMALSPSTAEHFPGGTIAFFIFFILVDYSTTFLKRTSNYLPRSNWLWRVTRRPGSNSRVSCDVLSKTPCSTEAPGMPSGHAATVAFVVHVWAHFGITSNWFGWALLMAVSWARFYRMCHSPVQIMVGWAVGVGWASVYERYACSM